jgi:sulfur carrier protein
MVADTQTIEVSVNGRRTATGARTVNDLLQQGGLASMTVATAVNGHFVPASRRATTQLQAGDQIEIVSPRQGG